MLKKMKLDFQSIPKICINLKRNHARRAAVREEFLKHGLQVEFFEAVDKKDIVVPELSPKKHEGAAAAGILACAMSHIAVIKLAKERGYPAVCVFEDDVVLCDDFRERIKYVEQLQEFDFDIFCLGGHFSKQIQNTDAESTRWNNILKIKHCNGTYGLIFTEKTYEFILRNWTYAYGSDQFYSDHVYHQFKTYAFVPFLVGCTKSVSDITESSFGYENIGWYYQQEALLKREYQNVSVPKQSVEVPRLPSRDLTDCTFIIPVRIDSEDREFNFLQVIQYLCDNFETNIIIKESDIDSKVAHLLKRINVKNCKVTHLYELTDSDIFHRTRLLNEMLRQVNTEVTINYDVDVMLLPEAYIHARDRITKEGYDLIYPYGKDMAQVQIKFPNKQNYQGEDLFNTQYASEWGSLCGHVQFFKTSSYISGFMENEEFISYGAEDRERMNRFIRLGYKVDWCSEYRVYHIEHVRGKNSSVQNPFFPHNEGLYSRLYQMNVEQILEYYRTEAKYLEKYK